MATVPDAGIELLLVRPRQARTMLSVANTRLYELIKAGEIDSFRDGKARLITVESIRAYIVRRLAETPSMRFG